MRTTLLSIAAAVGAATVLAACGPGPDGPGTTPSGPPPSLTTAPPATTAGTIPATVTRSYPGIGKGNPFFVVDGSNVIVSPDGAEVAAGCGDHVCVWEVASGEQRRTVPGRTPLGWSPDGRTMAVGDSQMAVAVVDASSGEERARLTKHTRPDVMDYTPGVNQGAFSPDGKELVTAGDDGLIIRWDTATWEEKQRWDLRSSISLAEVEWSPDGRRLAVADKHQGGVHVLVPGQDDTQVLPGPTRAFSVAWSPDGRWLAAAGRYDDGMSGDAEVNLYRTEDLQRVATHPVGFWAHVAFAPDSGSVAFTDYDTRAVHVWPVGGGPSRVIGGMAETMDDVRFAQGRLLTASTNEGIAVWDVEGNRRERTIVPDASSRPTRTVGAMRG